MMNWKVIDSYMENHDFLPADRYKIHNCVTNINSGKRNGHKIVNGYLTRQQLILIDEFGIKTICSRLNLGIQENYR